MSAKCKALAGIVLGVVVSVAFACTSALNPELQRELREAEAKASGNATEDAAWTSIGRRAMVRTVTTPLGTCVVVLYEDVTADLACP